MKYTKGFESFSEKKEIGNLIKTTSQSSLIISCLYVLGYYFSIFVLVYGLSLFINNIFYLILFTPIVCLIIARQLRGLENIVHFGSHYNISRNKKLNDWFVNLFCAYPMMQDIASYRHFHLKHHNKYGSNEDPCKLRFNLFIKAKPESINSLISFTLKNLLSYFSAYYREIGLNLKGIMIFFSYNTIFLYINSIVFDIQFAFLFLFMTNLSFWFILPVLRSIAEYGEHDYDRGNTIFDTTFNNISLLDKLLFHPTGDGYHLVHHLYPSVTWWNQRKVNDFLCQKDKGYIHCLIRTRFSDKYSK